MLFEHKATPAEYKAGRDLAIKKGWLELHESATFDRLTQPGKDCHSACNIGSDAILVQLRLFCAD